jgi:hypothetical protein
MRRRMRANSWFLAGLLGLAMWGVAGAEENVGRCYRFIFDQTDFSPADVASFASESEGLCGDLQQSLGISRAEPIPVYLKPGEGISTTHTHQNRAVDLYFARPIGGIEAPLVHETTHILVDSPHPVLREGLATAMQEELGSLLTHPTYGFSTAEWMAALRCAGQIVPLGTLEKEDWRAGPWESNIIAYVESGSFVRFLIDRYGLDSVVQALRWSERLIRVPARRDESPKISMDPLDRICQEKFGSPVASLEAAWLEDLRGKGGDMGELCAALRGGTVQTLLRKKLK